MEDRACVAFLQWALPRLGLRWDGYRRVRRQVCRRVARRLAELELDGLDAYRSRLESDPDEWAVLDTLMRITISRFWRDRRVFEDLVSHVLPALAAEARGRLDVWSAGCASGEEAYSVAIGWSLELAPQFPEVELAVLATDLEEAVLRRAREGCYSAGSVRELPASWRLAAFSHRGPDLCVREPIRRLVEVRRHDVRDAPPDGPFDLVLHRYLAFTYFDDDGQREQAARLADAIRPGGALVLAPHEAPPASDEFRPWPGVRSIVRRA